MNVSYWEQDSWLKNIDIAIVGSGIVGLFCALEARARFPKSKIVVFERGMLPSGASTKNAGFACFGSVSEIVSDLQTHTEHQVQDLVTQRLEGLRTLRASLGDHTIDYKPWGGYEVFLKKDSDLFHTCLSKVPYINELLAPLFNTPVFKEIADPFHFKKTGATLLFNTQEGQIDTGKMMMALLKKAIAKDILILNNATISKIEATSQGVQFIVNHTQEVQAKQLCVATNGFASQLLNEEVSPARAQVLITKPIKNLHIKGTFHLDEGYYYFRNINNRLLLGGGRNLDFKEEETTVMATSSLIQNSLETLLKEVILPHTPFKIEHRWTGIMGVGSQKTPIVKKVLPNVYCGVRLGGMGVAIGSTIGKKLAQLLVQMD